jgi:hypothetical protein
VAHSGLASSCDASISQVCWTTDKSSNRLGIVILVGHRILIRCKENHVIHTASFRDQNKVSLHLRLCSQRYSSRGKFPPILSNPASAEQRTYAAYPAIPPPGMASRSSHSFPLQLSRPCSNHMIPPGSPGARPLARPVLHSVNVGVQSDG